MGLPGVPRSVRHIHGFRGAGEECTSGTSESQNGGCYQLEVVALPNRLGWPWGHHGHVVAVIHH